MILADKIINERKKNGWSQEDLADKLGVSRQSVSKWEGAQSIPDLQKIVMMAEIFNVSTDYLLKDDIEALDRPEATFMGRQERPESEKVRTIDLQEANDFLESEKFRAPKMAFGVSLCILCPVLLIFLAGCSEAGVFGMSERMATFFGLGALFLLIAGGVYFILSGGLRKSEYNNLETNDIETAYGVSGLVKEMKASFSETYKQRLTLSIILYVLCVLPVVLAGALEVSDFVVICMVCIMLVIIAISTFNLINICIIMNSYEILLQDGDFTKEKKREERNASKFSGPYWTLVTAIYLGWSFMTRDWDRTWIVWPVAGVLFPCIAGIVKAIVGPRSEN